MLMEGGCGSAGLSMGAIVIRVLCPFCDTAIEVSSDQDGVKAHCPECGHTITVEPDQEPADSQRGFPAGDEWSFRSPWALGTAAIRLVRKLAQRPKPSLSPELDHGIGHQPVSGSKNGGLLKTRTQRRMGNSEWATIAFAITMFVGVPAAIIFFLIVVCAPGLR